MSISVKLALALLVGLLAILVPLNWVLFSQMKGKLLDAHRETMHAELLRLKGTVQLDPVTVPLPRRGFSLHIQKEQDQFFESVFKSPDFPLIDASLYSIEFLQLDSVWIYSQRTTDVQGVPVLLSVASSNDVYRESLSSLRSTMFLFSTVGVLLLVVLVFGTSRLMLTPLQHMIASASKIDASRVVQTIPVPSRDDETRVLALKLNEMIERIQHSMEMQSRFFDSAAHELKTPLAIMKAQLAQAKQLANDDVTRSVILSALEETERLTRTISGFLLASQIGNNKLDIYKVEFDFSEMLFDCLAQLDALAAARNIRFRLTQDETGMVILGDKDKLYTVLMNLLENAIRYAPANSLVEVTLQKNEHGFVLTIMNTLVVPFAHAQLLGVSRHAIPGSRGGMGIGLWICRQIVEAHGQVIALASEGLQFSARVHWTK